MFPDAQFVRVAPLSETDNPEDDKVYVFFTERAQEAEGAGGKVLYSRVARVCKVRGVSVNRDSEQVCVCVFLLRCVLKVNCLSTACSSCLVCVYYGLSSVKICRHA